MVKHPLPASAGSFVGMLHNIPTGSTNPARSARPRALRRAKRRTLFNRARWSANSVAFPCSTTGREVSVWIWAGSIASQIPCSQELVRHPLRPSRTRSRSVGGPRSGMRLHCRQRVVPVGSNSLQGSRQSRANLRDGLLVRLSWIPRLFRLANGRSARSGDFFRRRLLEGGPADPVGAADEHALLFLLERNSHFL